MLFHDRAVAEGLMHARLVALALLTAALTTACATAQPLTASMTRIALSANDNKQILENGVGKIVQNPAPDTVTILDIAARPPRVIGEVRAPTSVVGPPLSVAITPDEGLALVTAAMKINPADPTKTTEDTRVSVIDLRANPPAVIATLEAGKSPAGVSINRQGTLALVANRAEGTVSVFTIQGKTVAPAGKVTVGEAKAGVSHAAFTPDGKTALVSRDGDDRISVLSVEGTKVEYTKRDLYAGLRPYGLDIASNGAFATVANIGRGQGDNDTISLIDLRAQPIRVVETISVGQTPEGIKISPDSQHVAVVAMNGSNKPRNSPFYNDNGKLILFRVSGNSLRKVAEAPIGHWSQGAAFSGDGKTILVGNMVEKDVQVFDWDGSALREVARVKVNGGSAAVRTAEK
jgi:DNA-binding beta-propeller fold protein YncE